MENPIQNPDLKGGGTGGALSSLAVSDHVAPEKPAPRSSTCFARTADFRDAGGQGLVMVDLARAPQHRGGYTKYRF